MLLGVLVDLSWGMQDTLDYSGLYRALEKASTESLTRIETTLKTVIKICEREVVNEKDHMFVVGYGLKKYCVIDLLYLLEKIIANKSILLNFLNDNGQNDHEPLIRLLAAHGAPYARNYVEKYLSIKESNFLYAIFSDEYIALEKIVDILPLSCKSNLVQTSSDFHLNVTRKFIDNPLGHLFGVKPAEDVKYDATRQVTERSIEEACFLMQIMRIKSIKSTVHLLKELIGTESSATSSASSASRLRT